MFQSLFSQPQQMIEEWNQAVRQQLERLETMTDEAEKAHAEAAARASENVQRVTELTRKAQADGITRTTEAFERAAKLGQELGSRGAELPRQWRKLWLDLAKKSLETTGAAS
jgi:hypothetical protein